MIRIPTSVEDWQLIYEAANNRPGGREAAVLQAIFGDDYLLSIVELYLAQPDFDLAVFEAIEKFLTPVHSDTVNDRLLEACFQSGTEEPASMLLPTLMDYRLWPQLPRFAQSRSVSVQRCGAVILKRLVSGGFPTEQEVRSMVEHYRGLEDEHVRDLVARVDRALTHPERFGPELRK